MEERWSSVRGVAVVMRLSIMVGLGARLQRRGGGERDGEGKETTIIVVRDHSVKLGGSNSTAKALVRNHNLKWNNVNQN